MSWKGEGGRLEAARHNMYVNERNPSGTVRLQGVAVKKVEDFKYSGSTFQGNGVCGKG